MAAPYVGANGICQHEEYDERIKGFYDLMFVPFYKTEPRERISFASYHRGKEVFSQRNGER